jgi:hypothetical protein
MFVTCMQTVQHVPELHGSTNMCVPGRLAELREWLEARRAGRPPLEARVLQGILDASEVPYRCGHRCRVQPHSAFLNTAVRRGATLSCTLNTPVLHAMVAPSPVAEPQRSLDSRLPAASRWASGTLSKTRPLRRLTCCLLRRSAAPMWRSPGRRCTLLTRA